MFEHPILHTVVLQLRWTKRPLEEQGKGRDEYDVRFLIVRWRGAENLFQILGKGAPQDRLGRGVCPAADESELRFAEGTIFCEHEIRVGVYPKQDPKSASGCHGLLASCANNDQIKSSLATLLLCMGAEPR